MKPVLKMTDAEVAAALVTELEAGRGGFLACSWDCVACGENGAARPWRRPGETPEAAAARFAGETRGRCVAGCAFTAAPTPEGPRSCG